MSRKGAAILVLAGFISWSGSGLAGSLETLGASSRGTAMGGAMIAIANGWEAVYYNPSALALSRNSSSFQVSMISGELNLNDESSFAGGSGFKFATNRRLLRNRIGLGLLVGTTPSSSTSLSLDVGALLGGGGASWDWAMYQDAMPFLLSAGFGLRVADWLSFGLSMSQKESGLSTSYFPIIADPIVEILAGIRTGFVPTQVENMNFSLGAMPETEVSTGFNVSFRPIKYLSFGYLYKPETWARYKIRLMIEGHPASIVSGGPTMYLLDVKVPGDVETTIYGGAGHLPIPWNDGLLTLAWAHEMQNWDGFYPSTILYDWGYDTVFTQEWFENKRVRDPGLKDIEFDRYGLEYEGSAMPFLFWKLKNLGNPRFALRGGYYHWDSPQPTATHPWQVAMVDSDADVTSFGFGFSYERKNSKKALNDPLSAPRLSIDFHFQQIVIEDRNYVMAADEYGNIPLEDYYMRTDGGISQWGVQVTWWN